MLKERPLESGEGLANFWEDFGEARGGFTVCEVFLAGRPLSGIVSASGPFRKSVAEVIHNSGVKGEVWGLR